jgi:ferric-dicitrate binding protein FerR (iron transport regulator)
MKRHLWGDAHAKFTTTGQAAAATVLGTRWELSDTCRGTTVRVATGEVRVTNLRTHHSQLLFAPHRYFAKA